MTEGEDVLDGGARQPPGSTARMPGMLVVEKMVDVTMIDGVALDPIDFAIPLYVLAACQTPVPRQQVQCINWGIRSICGQQGPKFKARYSPGRIDDETGRRKKTMINSK